MPGLQVKHPAERFDLAYLFANGSEEDIKKLAQTAKEVVPGVSARCAMVHVADLRMLIPLLEGSTVRPEVVIDFPDGLGGWSAKEAEARQAREDGAVGGDIVVNLHHFFGGSRGRSAITNECRLVKQYLPETKLIAQIPYLWQFHAPVKITEILDLLPEAGIGCIKDWTTRQNFLLPPDTKLDISTETRVRYTEFVANYISTHNLKMDGRPLLIKIAGQVDRTNARQFVNAGADLIGLSHGKAKAVYEALL